MRQCIIQSVDQQIIIHPIKDVGNIMIRRILFEQAFHQFIAIFRQCFRCNHLVRSRSQLDKNLIFHTKISECQPALGCRIGLRKQFGNIFFILHLGTKIHENYGAENQQSVHQSFPLFEKAIDCNEKLVHAKSFKLLVLNNELRFQVQVNILAFAKRRLQLISISLFFQIDNHFHLRMSQRSYQSSQTTLLQVTQQQ